MVFQLQQVRESRGFENRGRRGCSVSWEMDIEAVAAAAADEELGIVSGHKAGCVELTTTLLHCSI